MRHRAAPFRVCPSGRSPNNLHSLNCQSYTGRCVPARCAGHGGRLLPPLSHGSCSTPSLGGILSWSQGATRCVRRTARVMRCLWRFLRCFASGGSVQNVSSERRQQSASTTLRLRSGARSAFSDVCGISARRLKRSRETTGGGQAPDAADSALADIPIPLSVLKGRCIGRRPGEVRKTPHFRALVLARCCGQVQQLRHTLLRVAMVLLTAWRPRRSDARQRTQRGWRGT